MSLQALREFTNRQSVANASLAAIAAILDSRLGGAPLDPAVAARIGDLLAAAGAPADLLDGLTDAQSRAAIDELRVNAAIDGRLLRSATSGTGWTHTDRAMLEGAGDFSSHFIVPLSCAVVPALAGLAARLEAPGATFLDIGVGIAGLAIAVARQWPHAKVTGIDPWQPSLAIARDRVAAAGLRDRIELREQGIEQLADERAFDVAWLPTMFVPDRVVASGCARLLAALKPGGWVLVNALKAGIDAQTAALWRLRTTMFGNSNIASADLESTLRATGFADVRTLPSPPGGFMALVVGRRPE